MRKRRRAVDGIGRPPDSTVAELHRKHRWAKNTLFIVAHACGVLRGWRHGEAASSATLRLAGFVERAWAYVRYSRVDAAAPYAGPQAASGGA